MGYTPCFSKISNVFTKLWFVVFVITVMAAKLLDCFVNKYFV